MDLQTVTTQAVSYKVALLPIAALILGPMAIAIVVAILNLPVLRRIVGGVCYAGGKWISFFLTRHLGAPGARLEEAFEGFLTEVVVGRFLEGLDSDDATTNPA